MSSHIPINNKKIKLSLHDLKHHPRKYQIEAARKAISARESIIVLPTGTGKTLVALIWIKTLLENNVVSKVLVLEPTRILVEQIANYFKEIGSLDSHPLHGLMPRRIKENVWGSKVVVTTPEEMLYNKERLDDFDAIVVDECHHSVGNDAFKKVLEMSKAKYRLGLSAHIPKRHRKTIESLIGRIFEWSISDPEISPYVPEWIGEIYEAPLDKEAFEVYKDIEARWILSSGREKILYSLALRFLSRDGALALKESLRKPTKLAKLLEPLKEKVLKLPDLHKLVKLRMVLDQHDFDKVIVFVDRVVVAKRIVQEFNEYNPVLIVGRKSRGERVKESLEKAREETTKLIVSTSAGEEGLDLPSADLLVIWSNVVSPLRFIQRHGRILRKTKPLKYVVYIVTPDTVDLNAFIDSIEYAKRVGVDVPLADYIIRKMRKRSPRTYILDILERPIPAEWIAEISGMTRSEVDRALRMLGEEGDVFYIFTHLGKTYSRSEHIAMLEEEFPEYFNPSKDAMGTIKVWLGSRKKTLSGNFNDISREMKNLLTKGKNMIIGPMQITIREVRNYVEFVYSLKYNFKITDIDVLIAVLKNAFTPEVYRQYG